MPADRPKLLVLTPSADGYGSDKAMADVVEALAEQSDVTVVSAADGTTLDRLRADGLAVVVGPDWALRRRAVAPAQLPATALRVVRSVRLVRQRNRTVGGFDAVYANTVASLLLPVLRPALPRSVPIVVHVREIPRTSDRFNRLFFRRIAAVADAVVTNSTATADFVRTTAPRLAARVQIVHDGVAELPAAQAPAAPSPDRPFEITCVGRIHPQKGHQVLLDALVLARRDGRDWRVHVWGDTLPEHAAVRAGLDRTVAEHDLSARVVWHGYGHDTAAMYDAMDVAVVPSTWPEGFSLVAAEGQMAGLPVVATVPGGPADIVVDGVTGRLVPANDAAALYRALAALHDAPHQRPVMGAAGRERARANFTTARAAGRTAAVVLAAARPDARSSTP